MGVPAPLGAVLNAGLFDLLQTILKQHDAIHDLAPVAFDLGFAWTAHKKPLPLLPLGQFNLQHAFVCDRLVAENL